MPNPGEKENKKSILQSCSILLQSNTRKRKEKLSVTITFQNSHFDLCKAFDLNPNHIGVKYFLILWGGGHFEPLRVRDMFLLSQCNYGKNTGNFH